MKTKCTKQRIISGLLVLLSLASLALLLQYRTPLLGGPRPADIMKSAHQVGDMYALFTSGVFEHRTHGLAYLLACLSLIAVLSLFKVGYRWHGASDARRSP